MKVRAQIFGLLLIASIPRIASAEVSDKFPTTTEHWLIALPVAFLVLLAARWRWWMAVPIALPLTMIIWADAELPIDNDIGTDLLRERGWPYFFSLWGSELLVAGALILGVVIGWRRTKSGARLPDTIAANSTLA